MTDNVYNILDKFPEKEPSIKNVIDLIYSIYSFKLINEYFFNYIVRSVLDTINKKLTNKEIIKYKSVLEINVEIFFLEYLYWSISQSNNKQNRGNLFFQKKINNILEISNLIDKFIFSIYESVNLKSTDKKIEKIRNNILDKISLKKIIPFLEKNHLPPLTSKNSFENHKIKEKKSINLINDEKGYEYYLYRENDIISKIPITYLTTGFQMKRLRYENYISVNLRYFINPKYIKLLKKRYNKKTNFNNAVFYLLSYYHLNGLLEDTGYINDNIPKIKNNKLNNLYKKSIELIGTPLTVSPDKKYFGLFPDIEQHFGSLGSFFDIEPVSGFYSIHLPYSFLFIKNIIKKVENWLNSSNKLTFLIWAPININIDGFIITRKILLEDLYKKLIPQLSNSKYFQEYYYYSYDKNSILTNSTHIIYILSNYK
jgi:hypothetical protein